MEKAGLVIAAIVVLSALVIFAVVSRRRRQRARFTAASGLTPFLIGANASNLYTMGKPAPIPSWMMVPVASIPNLIGRWSSLIPTPPTLTNIRINPTDGQMYALDNLTRIVRLDSTAQPPTQTMARWTVVSVATNAHSFAFDQAGVLHVARSVDTSTMSKEDLPAGKASGIFRNIGSSMMLPAWEYVNAGDGMNPSLAIDFDSVDNLYGIVQPILSQDPMKGSIQVSVMSNPRYVVGYDMSGIGNNYRIELKDIAIDRLTNTMYGLVSSTNRPGVTPGSIMSAPASASVIPQWTLISYGPPGAPLTSIAANYLGSAPMTPIKA